MIFNFTMELSYSGHTLDNMMCPYRKMVLSYQQWFLYRFLCSKDKRQCPEKRCPYFCSCSKVPAWTCMRSVTDTSVSSKFSLNFLCSDCSVSQLVKLKV